MAARKRKVLVASSLVHFDPVTISDELWLAAEAKYKQLITADVRQRIEEVTQQYVARAIFEHGAVPVSDARNYLGKIRLAAERLRDLVSLRPGEVDGPWYARHLLMNHIRDKRLGNVRPKMLKSGRRDPRNLNDPIAALVAVLTSCDAACVSALSELDNPNYSVAEGEAWGGWIRQLTAIMKDAGLRAGAAKDIGHEEDPSPFVFLVQRLQRALPVVQHTQSAGALAKAINAARRH